MEFITLTATEFETQVSIRIDLIQMVSILPDDTTKTIVWFDIGSNKYIKVNDSFSSIMEFIDG